LIERYAGCGRSLLAFLHLIQDEAGFDYSRSNATQLALRERSMQTTTWSWQALEPRRAREQ
jgi:hypothetical protein